MTVSLDCRLNGKGRGAFALAILTAAVALGALAAVACDGTPDSLLGDNGTGAATATDAGQPVVDPSDGSLLDPDGGNATALALAERLYRDLEPQLKTSCGGNACHEGSTSAPLWLKGPNTYASIKTYDQSQVGEKKIIVSDTLQSRLFTKGQHTGAAMVTPDGTGNLGDKVKKWLDVEAAALKGAKLPGSDPVAIVIGATNTVDLSSVPGAVAGAKITFNATLTGKILALSAVKLVAPAGSGIHIAHPIFVQVPATAKPVEDPADNGSNVDDTAGSGKSIPIGPGTFILTGFNWQPTDKLKIEFAKIGPGTVTGGGGDGGTGGGCKNVAGFQAIADVFRGGQVNGNALTPNCTAGCHKAGGGGDGALDLNALVGGAPDYTAACAQALTKVDKANHARSAIILHPTGQSGNHGGGTVSDVAGFTAQIESWLSGE